MLNFEKKIVHDIAIYPSSRGGRLPAAATINGREGNEIRGTEWENV